MKFIALLLVVANAGFFYFHEEIIQNPVQLELMPLPKDIPQLKLVKEINAETPKVEVAAEVPKIPEKSQSENTATSPETKSIQEVALAQSDTTANHESIKIASQARDVLNNLKTEADRVTSSIDQAVSPPPSTIIPAVQNPPIGKTVDAAKSAEKLEKPAETTQQPKIPDKTAKIETPVEKTKAVQMSPEIEKNIEPVKLVEMPPENKSATTAHPKKVSISSDKKTDSKKENTPPKNDPDDQKECFYSGIYEKKVDAKKASQWLEKQQVISKVKDWKNRIKSGRVIYLPAANQEVAKKLTKKLAAKKVKGFGLVRNEKGGYLISLGTFRSEKSLQNRLNELKKKGFHGLKTQDRYLELSVFRLKIEAKTAQKPILEKFSSTFKVPKPQSIACE